MFETVAVESKVHPIRRGRVAVLPVSIALHALAVSAALLSTIWDVSLPTNAPAQFQAFHGIQPLPPLPPERPPVTVEPPSPQGPKTPDSVFSQPPAANPTTVTPDSIPDTIPIVGPPTSELREIAIGGPWPKGSPSGDGSGVSTEPVPVGEGSATMPVVMRRVQPEYPKMLVGIGLRGVAVVECIVGQDGVITSATVISATHPQFGDSARKAVMQWKFLPGRLNGDPVATIFRLTVNFEVKR